VFPRNVVNPTLEELFSGFGIYPGSIFHLWPLSFTKDYSSSVSICQVFFYFPKWGDACSGKQGIGFEHIVVYRGCFIVFPGFCGFPGVMIKGGFSMGVLWGL